MEDLNERQLQILRLLAANTEPLRGPELARQFGWGAFSSKSR